MTAAPPASTAGSANAEPSPSVPVPARTPIARMIVTTASPALPAEAIRFEDPRLPSDPTPRTVAAPRSVIPEPNPSRPHADGARSRPAEAPAGERSRRSPIDEPEGAAGHREYRGQGPASSRRAGGDSDPVRAAAGRASAAPRDAGEEGHRPISVRIGSLEVRIVSPDPRRGPPFARRPRHRSPVQAVPSSPSARLSRGFGAFGLVQG